MDVEYKIVSYEDVLKASYENKTNNMQIIISYHTTDSAGNNVIKTDNLQNYTYNENGDLVSLLDGNIIPKGNISFSDANGNPIIIDNLHYYSFDEKGKLVTLSPGEIIYLLQNNKSDSSIFVSEKELSSDLISSDLNYVNDSMNSLVGYIDDSGKLAYTAESGDAGLVGAIYDVTNYYKNINNTLYNGIAEEAGAISTIAGAYSALDSAAASAAQNNIGGGYYGGGGGGSKSKGSTIQGLTADEVNASTKKLIDETKSSALAGKFDEITSFLGKSLEPGKIGKIDVSKLGLSLNSIVPSLKDDSNKCSEMMGSITDFMSEINSSGKLKGSNWKNVKENLETYKSLLTASINSSSFISDVLSSAKKMVEDFLYPDTELDDSNLPELEKEYESLSIQITELTSKVSSMRSSQKKVCDYVLAKNSLGIEYNQETNCRLEPSNEEIQAIQNTIDGYQEKSDELKKQIDKINNFAIVVNNAQKMINDAASQVKEAFANPVNNTDGNSEFKSNFYLDLSAYGITSGSSCYDLLKNYIKPIEPEKTASTQTDGSKDNGSKATFVKIGEYEIDTSKMSSKAKKELAEVMENWPESMEKQRLVAIQSALSLMNKGITYSMDKRWAKNKDGSPACFDCSSFVTYCLRKSGLKINARRNVYTGSYLDSEINDYVAIKNRKNLIPGDVGLYSNTMKDNGANHIGMYIGRDKNGKEVWIEMNAGKNGIIVKHGNRGNGHCGFEYARRYTAYV